MFSVQSYFLYYSLGTHYVSLCSLSCYLVALIAMIVRGEMGGYGMDRSHTTEMYIVMGFADGAGFLETQGKYCPPCQMEQKTKFSLEKTKKG